MGDDSTVRKVIHTQQAKMTPSSDKEGIKVFVPWYDKPASNAEFGNFYYRNLSKPVGAIEIDPQWLKENITTITLPKEVQYRFGATQRVHKDSVSNWKQVFDTLAKNEDLMNMVKTCDGLYVTRHKSHNPEKDISNHSWGIAIDINAGSHPQGKSVDTYRQKSDPNLHLWEKVFEPAGFSWGNDFSTPDPMHYELLKKSR